MKGLNLASPLLVLAAACGDTEPALEHVTEKISLTQMETCGAVEGYIEAQLIEEMSRHFEALRNEDDFGWPEAGFDDAIGAPNPGADERGPDDFTDTNTREAGVDEADFLKTDGTRTFVLSGRKLYATRSWPARDLRVVDHLELEGQPQEMFLVDDRIVVFAHDWEEGEPGSTPGDAAIPCDGGEDCARFFGHSVTRVTVVDASSLKLAVLRRIRLNGRYQTSRRIDDAIRIVNAETIARPPDLRYWPESAFDPNRDRAAWLRALDQLEAENEAKIRSWTLAEFLPDSATIDASGEETILERECVRFHRPNASIPLGLTSVWTMDLASNALDRTSVFGSAALTYASEDTLYIASPHQWWRPRSGDANHTYFHAFDLSQAESTRYRGSFGVPGHVLDPYSIDEHAWHVRVASHVRVFRHSPDQWRAPELSNRVTVLRKLNFGFTETGRTQDLAPNEQLFSARLEGDRGFLVTFERIDPLFTLDLSDPADPHVVGELKVPGFSTYIHPIGEDHLLTIGEHMPDPSAPDDFPLGLKLSVFDVSDFARPAELHVAYLGQGYSEASWDPKAFTYFPSRQTLAIPVSRWSEGSGWDAFRSELRLFKIDLVEGISSRGAIDVRDLYPRPDDVDTWRYDPTVRRGLLVDDFAYAVSDAGIKAARIDAPDTTVGSCLFR